MELISQDTDLTAQSAESSEADEPLEVNAEDLINGSIGSAYDEHEAFDAPGGTAEEDEDAEVETETAEAAEIITGEEADDDAGNV